MSVPLFAGVDNDKNFPPEIREQLAKSDELKFTIVPMSETQKDNLSEKDLWHGRVIYNLNKKAIETWNSITKTWNLSLTSNYTPPVPTPPWDRYYRLPKVVRDRLALTSDFKHMIVSMDHKTRSELTQDELWNGRVIFNTTIENHQVWNDEYNIWITLLNDTYVPPKVQRTWSDWDTVISLTNGQELETTVYYVSGYVNQNGRVSLIVNAAVQSEDVLHTGLPLRASLPLPNALPSGLTVFGRCIIKRWIPSLNEHVEDPGHIVLEGNSQYMLFYYEDVYNGVLGNAVVDAVDDQGYVRVFGNLMYETA